MPRPKGRCCAVVFVCKMPWCVLLKETCAVCLVGNCNISLDKDIMSVKLTPKFYIVELRFTGVYMFLIFALKH